MKVNRSDLALRNFSVSNSAVPMFSRDSPEGTGSAEEGEQKGAGRSLAIPRKVME